MSAREWKPGDVALWIPAAALVFRMKTPGRNRWVEPDGSVHTIEDEHLRALVVIDAEDREQVRAVLEAFADQFSSWQPELDQNVTRLQAALRSLLAPPKPDEPLGLGAVAVDAEGRQWVRVAHGLNEYEDWKPSWESARRQWRDVPAVRVLSLGVDQ